MSFNNEEDGLAALFGGITPQAEPDDAPAPRPAAAQPTAPQPTSQQPGFPAPEFSGSYDLPAPEAPGAPQYPGLAPQQPVAPAAPAPGYPQPAAPQQPGSPDSAQPAPQQPAYPDFAPPAAPQYPPTAQYPAASPYPGASPYPAEQSRAASPYPAEQNPGQPYAAPAQPASTSAEWPQQPASPSPYPGLEPQQPVPPSFAPQQPAAPEYPAAPQYPVPGSPAADPWQQSPQYPGYPAPAAPEPPTFDQPSYEPSYEPPTYAQPSYDPPSYGVPAASSEPPVYGAPTGSPEQPPFGAPASPEPPAFGAPARPEPYAASPSEPYGNPADPYGAVGQPDPYGQPTGFPVPPAHDPYAQAGGQPQPPGRSEPYPLTEPEAADRSGRAADPYGAAPGGDLSTAAPEGAYGAGPGGEASGTASADPSPAVEPAVEPYVAPTGTLVPNGPLLPSAAPPVDAPATIARPTVFEWIALVLSVIAGPVGLLVAAVSTVIGTRRRGWTIGVARSSLVLGVLSTIGFAIGGTVLWGLYQDQLRHNDLVAASAEFCAAAEADPTMVELPILGFPQQGHSIPDTIDAMQVWTDRWTDLAAVSPEELAAGMQTLAGKGQLILEAVTSSRYVDDAANQTQITQAENQAGVSRWFSTYCVGE